MSAISNRRKLVGRLLALLTLAQIVPLMLFARHSQQQGQYGLPAITALAVLLTVLGAWGAWRNAAWTGWPTIIALSWGATIGFWQIATGEDPLGWAQIALSATVFGLVLLLPAPSLTCVTWPVKVFCASVAALTGYVTFWGLFFPTGLGIDLPSFAQGFNQGMPFVPAIPPLHASFIGALYLGATVICVSHLFAKQWGTAALLQGTIFLWTFILLLVTLRHLDQFRWDGPSVWFWFIAYLAFPAVSLWVGKRIELPPERDAVPLPGWARGALWLQGICLIAVSLLGFFVPSLLVDAWPWKLPVLLANIYSAPFATFGLGSCVAALARGSRRRAVLPFCLAMVALSLGAIAASLLHRDKFNFEMANAWIWFATLTILVLLNLMIAVTLSARSSKQSAVPSSANS